MLRAAAPVPVDFWAPWWAPCPAVAPALERIAGERAGSLKVAKVNVDDEPHLADPAGVNGIPFLALYATASRSPRSSARTPSTRSSARWAWTSRPSRRRSADVGLRRANPLRRRRV